MSNEVVLPLWLALLLIVIALLALLDRILIPGIRWFIRRRVNRAINEVNSRLKISLRPFQLTKRQVLLDRLVYDAQVIEAMQAYAKEKNMPHEVAQARVIEYAKEIVPAFNAYVYFRFGYWLSKKLARMLFSVRVGFLENKRLEDIDPEATVVFVMNHRSNMDYILVSYLVAQESTLSYAVGEWARVWPLQTILRAMGAFFVRRNSGNSLYRKVLERYIHMATEEGVCQAIFLEGGLSHDGLLRQPKLGFLDYMLRDYSHTSPRDIVFVPIGINYDRVLEDKSLLRRRNPDAQKRSKWFVLKTTIGFYRKSLALSVPERRRRFGYAGVNFGKSFSIREFCAQHDIEFSSLPKSDRFHYVRLLAEEIMRRIAHVTPILPTPLVATVFRRTRGEALNSFEIKRRVHDLIRELQDHGAPIRDSEIPQERTIAGAIDILRYRHIVSEHGGWYHAEPAALDLLDFYANSIAHWTSDSTSAPAEFDERGIQTPARSAKDAT